MAGHSRIPLARGWMFKQQDEDDNSPNEWLYVAHVPTQVHSDLLAHKKIPDPYLDLNERSVQWVGEKTWIYRLEFDFPQQQQDGVRTDIVFQGLDTFATVSLNGSTILSADNMFVSYRVDVTNIISSTTKNDLQIVFDSALLRGRELVKSHAHEHTFYVRQTESSRIPVRKSQCNWGWDWGPILMTAGPWKPIFIEQYTGRVDDVWAQNQVSPDLKTCSGTLFVTVDGNIKHDDRVLVTLSRGGSLVFRYEARLDHDKKLAQVPFKLENPDLWYPLHYGSQARYELKAELVDSNDQTQSVLIKFTGFRRTELIQEPDNYGKSFYFRINNIDIFSGGSCWIPADAIQAKIYPQRFQDWVNLLAKGNQNMLRIWGGGVYEHDTLIEACDELGIMIWHDFQFACGSYPVYDSFLANFELEARQQIRRLRTHPSVVIWAGNNEDYQVQERYKLDYDYENKDPESWRQSSFPARYIYEYLLPKLIQEEDPFMLYHPSSPWGDGKPLADASVGDIHQWHIWHGLMKKYQEAKDIGGRFVSEFGMEAYPHLDTIRSVITDPEQRYPGSIPMDAHNKAINHERRMFSYVIENFHPRSLDLATYTHLTQIVQAETMRYAYKAWRRDWGDAINGRRCGGVLVWQLNDCWPTISWAVVDYYLVPKPAYYAIARALRPLDVSVVRTLHDWSATDGFVDEQSELKTGQVDHTLPARKGVFDIWVSNGKLQPVNVSVTTRFISVRCGKDVHSPITNTSEAKPNATTSILDSHPAPPSIPNANDLTQRFDLALYDPYVIHVSMEVDGQTVATDTAWPEPIKYLTFPDRGLSFVLSSAADKFTVSAKRPVKGLVFGEKPGVTLSDNGIDLVPGEEQTITVTGALATDLQFTYIGAPASSFAVS